MIFTDAALGDFLNGATNWVSDTFRLYLVDNTAFTPGANPFLSDLPGGAIIGYGTIPSKTVSGRTASAGLVPVTGLGSGRTVAGMWVVRWTGTAASSRLVAFTDRNDDTTAISYVTAGVDLSIQFNPNVLTI